MNLSPEFLYIYSNTLIILMKIVCLVLSYKIIKLGYNLISGGVKGEFKFSSNFVGFKADLISISPGLLFLLLGVLFMCVAIYTNKNVIFQKETASGEQPIPKLVDSTFPIPDSSDFIKQFQRH